MTGSFRCIGYQSESAQDVHMFEVTSIGADGTATTQIVPLHYDPASGYDTGAIMGGAGQGLPQEFTEFAQTTPVPADCPPQQWQDFLQGEREETYLDGTPVEKDAAGNPTGAAAEGDWLAPGETDPNVAEDRPEEAADDGTPDKGPASENGSDGEKADGNATEAEGAGTDGVADGGDGQAPAEAAEGDDGETYLDGTPVEKDAAGNLTGEAAEGDWVVPGQMDASLDPSYFDEPGGYSGPDDSPDGGVDVGGHPQADPLTSDPDRPMSHDPSPPAEPAAATDHGGAGDRGDDWSTPEGGGGGEGDGIGGADGTGGAEGAGGGEADWSTPESSTGAGGAGGGDGTGGAEGAGGGAPPDGTSNGGGSADHAGGSTPYDDGAGGGGGAFGASSAAAEGGGGPD